MPKEIIGNLSKSEERYLTMAMNLAKSSEVQRNKHGAIIVRGGRILSVGINKRRNNPLIFENKDEIINGSHIHAEIDAMRKVTNLQGAKIYIARVNNNGKPGLSRPCPQCYDRIVNAGITKVVYT